MKVSLPTLKGVLLSNVGEIKFVRRRPKLGAAPTRRMFCTNALKLLNSMEGRLALNYRPALNTPHFNTSQKNLLITWDIFMQDYRCINMAACELITFIPAGKEFWKYFNEVLAGMSQKQKIEFMNK
jgi:hypothetical protein